MHLGTGIGIVVRVRVGQPSSALHAPYGIESADHMATIKNGGDVEFRAVYLCRLGDARVYLPAWTLGS